MRDGHTHTHTLSQQAGDLIDPVVRRSPLLLLCEDVKEGGKRKQYGKKGADSLADTQPERRQASRIA